MGLRLGTAGLAVFSWDWKETCCTAVSGGLCEISQVPFPTNVKTSDIDTVVKFQPETLQPQHQHFYSINSDLFLSGFSLFSSCSVVWRYTQYKIMYKLIQKLQRLWIPLSEEWFVNLIVVNAAVPEGGRGSGLNIDLAKGRCLHKERFTSKVKLSALVSSKLGYFQVDTWNKLFQSKALECRKVLRQSWVQGLVPVGFWVSLKNIFLLLFLKNSCHVYNNHRGMKRLHILSYAAGFVFTGLDLSAWKKVCVCLYLYLKYLGHNLYEKQNIPKMTFVSSH